MNSSLLLWSLGEVSPYPPEAWQWGSCLAGILLHSLFIVWWYCTSEQKALGPPRMCVCAIVMALGASREGGHMAVYNDVKRHSQTHRFSAMYSHTYVRMYIFAAFIHACTQAHHNIQLHTYMHAVCVYVYTFNRHSPVIPPSTPAPTPTHLNSNFECERFLFTSPCVLGTQNSYSVEVHKLWRSPMAADHTHAHMHGQLIGCTQSHSLEGQSTLPWFVWLIWLSNVWAGDSFQCSPRPTPPLSVYHTHSHTTYLIFLHCG